MYAHFKGVKYMFLLINYCISINYLWLTFVLLIFTLLVYNN